MTKNYNQIYEKLVKNKVDFVGMIAYSIYKHEKIAKIKNGENISEFIRLKSDKKEIERYRKESEELFNIFIQFSIDENIKNVKNNLVTEINSITLKNLPKNTPCEIFINWHNSGASGIVGNLWTAIITVIFVWLFSSQKTWENTKENAVNNLTDLIKNEKISDQKNILNNIPKENNLKNNK